MSGSAAGGGDGDVGPPGELECGIDTVLRCWSVERRFDASRSDDTDLDLMAAVSAVRVRAVRALHSCF